MTSSKSPAAQKPTSGEIRSALPIEVACAQSTPEVASWPRAMALAMPTPMIEPISVCELDAYSLYADVEEQAGPQQPEKHEGGTWIEPAVE